MHILMAIAGTMVDGSIPLTFQPRGDQPVEACKAHSGRPVILPPAGDDHCFGFERDLSRVGCILDGSDQMSSDRHHLLESQLSTKSWRPRQISCPRRRKLSAPGSLLQT